MYQSAVGNFTIEKSLLDLMRYFQLRYALQIAWHAHCSCAGIQDMLIALFRSGSISTTALLTKNLCDLNREFGPNFPLTK